MQTLMNTQNMMAEAVPYEPPRMTIVPIRATGAMLIGSMQGSMVDETLLNFENRSDNVASEWTTLDGNGESNQGWGDSFF